MTATNQSMLNFSEPLRGFSRWQSLAGVGLFIGFLHELIY